MQGRRAEVSGRRRSCGAGAGAAGAAVRPCAVNEARRQSSRSRAPRSGSVAGHVHGRATGLFGSSPGGRGSAGSTGQRWTPRGRPPAGDCSCSTCRWCRASVVSSRCRVPGAIRGAPAPGLPGVERLRVPRCGVPPLTCSDVPHPGRAVAGAAGVGPAQRHRASPHRVTGPGPATPSGNPDAGPAGAGWAWPQHLLRARGRVSYTGVLHRSACHLISTRSSWRLVRAVLRIAGQSRTARRWRAGDGIEGLAAGVGVWCGAAVRAARRSVLPRPGAAWSVP